MLESLDVPREFSVGTGDKKQKFFTMTVIKPINSFVY